MTSEILVLAALSLQPRLPESQATRIATVITKTEACKQYDPLFLLALMNRESSLDWRRVNGHSGTAGLMQIHPVHWPNKSLGWILNMERNVSMGCKILSRYDDRGYDLHTKLSFYNNRKKKGPSSFSKEVMAFLPQATGAIRQ